MGYASFGECIYLEVQQLAPENRPKPERKVISLPTITLKGRTVKLRGCIYLEDDPFLLGHCHLENDLIKRKRLCVFDPYKKQDLMFFFK